MYLIYGPDPKSIVQRYTTITGKPALPPAWTFGLWLSTSFTTEYDEGTVTSFLDGMAERDIPVSVFHFDCFWMPGFKWCDYEFDKDYFPDAKGQLQRIKSRGIHVRGYSCLDISFSTDWNVDLCMDQSLHCSRERDIRRGRRQGLFPQEN